MKLLKFFEFILESRTKIVLPVVFSDEFKDKLDNIGGSFISSAFKELYDDEALKEFTFISVGDSSDTITYVDSSKVNEYIKKNHPTIETKDYLSWIIKNKKQDTNLLSLPKTEIKIGRFINKFFPNTFTDKAIEDFVNKWKSSEQSWHCTVSN